MKEKIYDVAILGAGASGMFASIFASKNQKKCILIEKNAKIGKKLLATGNGRCNLANINLDEKFYNTSNVGPIIRNFDVDTLLHFFKTIGVETFADDEGRIYPLSQSANCVVEALSQKINSLPIEVLTDSEVLSCEKVGENFVTCLASKKIVSKKVIVATGGSVANIILKNIDETFVTPRKVLVGFKCEKYEKQLSGLRVDARVTVELGNKVFCEEGQVQFRDDGISGIVIFNVSAFISKFAQLPVKISLNLMPKYEKTKFFDLLLSRQVLCPHLKIKDFLLSILHHKIAGVIFQRAGIKNLDEDCKNLTPTQLSRICDVVFDFCFILTRISGVAQVEIGGVSIDNLINLQSKNIDGLYLCGESAGVYGYCGGFNLMWAFASGAYCGEQVGK